MGNPYYKPNTPEPALKNGTLGRTFQFTIPGDKTYTAFYSTDLKNGEFLNPVKITFGTALWQYTEPGRTDFTRLTQTSQFQTGYLASVAALKSEMASQNRTDLGKNAADLSGQTKTWDTTPTPTNPEDPVTVPPNWVAPDVPDVTPSAVALPEEIQQLQNTADATIEALKMPGEEQIIIQYPADAHYGKTQDHILFEQFTYTAPQQTLLSPPGGQFGTNAANIITTGLTRNTNIRKFIGMTRLPMPNQISISNGVSWGEDRANPVEAAAFFTALPAVQQALGQNLAQAGNNLFNSFSDFAQRLGNGGNGGNGGNASAQLLLSSFISQYMLGKVGINVDPAQFIARGTGTTINPNLELLFNGPKLRSFAFAFDFAPNNESDALAARRTMRFFRQGMAPKKLTTNTIFIGSPNVFRISYRGNGSQVIDGLNRFKICALTTCELNYTPEGLYQSYDDSRVVSMPVRTTMTLSFTELTPIFEQDYNKQDPKNPDPSVQDAFGLPNNLGTDSSVAGITPEFDNFKYDDIGF